MSTLKKNRENIDSLINMLALTDDKLRTKARNSLVTIGKPSVSCLALTLQNSESNKARWEAAKALGAIRDAKAIPSLIYALEDEDSDVAWLAAEALKKLKKDAWPGLFRVLIKKGSDSVKLRHGAHHILRNQNDSKFNDSLEILRKALESDSAPEEVPLAAYNFLGRLREQ